MRYLMLWLLMSALPIGAALAHDSWINSGGYRNAGGELCCGEQDCFEVKTSDIEITSGGYLIKPLKETVPFNEAQPSPDGHYWRCAWAGLRRCFFAPPPVM